MIRSNVKSDNYHSGFNLIFMKTIATLLLITIVLFSCKKEEPPTPSNSTTTINTTNTPPPPYADYWGCWREATGKIGAYDIILTEDTVTPHIFEFATLCIPEPIIPAQPLGIFRNDTLILDNGIYEYWCFIVGDTMLYSAYGLSVATEKFTKI